MNNRCYDFAVRQRAQALPQLYMRWAHRGGTFACGRNAEKRGTEAERRSALIARMARRRRASWKLETRNPNMGRPHGVPA